VGFGVSSELREQQLEQADYGFEVADAARAVVQSCSMGGCFKVCAPAANEAMNA
jgi:hypothetical protein